MRRRPHPTARLGALALFATLVACSTGGDAGGVPVAEDARFSVAQRADGTTEDLDSLDAWLKAVPFEVVLPASLPSGVAVVNALVILPYPGLDPRTPGGATSATLVLHTADGGEIVVAQTLARRGPPASRPPAGVALNLNGAEGAELFERLGGPADVATLLVWRSCDRDFALATGEGAALPREEVLVLARAFIEGCES